VHARDDFWHQKYREDAEGNVIPAVAGGAVAHAGNGHDNHGDAHGGHAEGIHMPSPSYMPLIAAAGLPIIATGLIYDYALVAVGATLLVVGLFGWVFEPATEED
jgi:cytochrome c oxidase subunit 1